MKVEILDLGINNLKSLSNSIRSCSELEIRIINHYEDNTDFSLLILPGLGNFRSGMNAIEERGLDKYIRNKLDHGSCLLGICLGMQLLGMGSQESPNIRGLSLIEGNSFKFNAEFGERIPNVGWAQVELKKDFEIFSSLELKKDFYFVHSFHFTPLDNKAILSETKFGSSVFASGVKFKRIIGVQFHPEKSSNIGQFFLTDVINWAKNEA